MANKLALLASAFLAFTVSSLAADLGQVPADPADVVLRGGRVYIEAVEGKKWAEAVSVKDGLIHTIGSAKAVSAEIGPNTKVVELKGRVVLPAFNDAHIHVFTGGLSLSRCDLTGVKSVGELESRLKAFAAANPKKKWLFGFGWDHTAWPTKEYPKKTDLDAAVSDRPVMLWHADDHYAVVNSRALELLGAPADATGLLMEQAAEDAKKKVDNPTYEELKLAFLDAQTQLLKFGVTSIQGNVPLRDVETYVRVLDELYTTKQLRVRVAVWGNLENPEEFAAIKEKYKHLPPQWVQFAALKGFVDGVISARTAAMVEPYADDKTVRGEPNYTQARLDELVLKANKMGFPVALHAIGDRAVGMSITAFQNVKKQLFNSKLRNRVEHIEVSSPPLIERFQALGVIASVQPSHMVYDVESENYNETRLGRARVQNAFAWKSFERSKVHIAFGTDWPVMPINPMIGLMGAVYRTNYNGKPANGWLPLQKLTMDDAVENYTLGGAYATNEDHIKGTIREGKLADLVVLSADPWKSNAKTIQNITADLTLVDGH